jgi:hypothetical protein
MSRAADLAAGKIAAVKTALIEFTDGDDAIAVADAGVVTLLTTAVAKSEGGAVTANIAQGVAKMWIHFDGNTGNDIRDSVNISSVADSSTGRYTYTYTNNMGNFYYQFTHSCGGAGATSGDEQYGSTGNANSSSGLTTSTFHARNRRYDGNTYDVDIDAVMLHGDLA